MRCDECWVEGELQVYQTFQFWLCPVCKQECGVKKTPKGDENGKETGIKRPPKDGARKVNAGRSAAADIEVFVGEGGIPDSSDIYKLWPFDD